MATPTFVQLAGLILGALTLTVSGQSYSDIACVAANRPARLSNATGYFTTPNFPQNYPDNTVCHWLIESTSDWVRLDFTSFYTEATYDIVTIYDGDNEMAPILASFEGVYQNEVIPPFDIVSSQKFMLVTFVSDPFTNRLGFGATFTSIDEYEVVDACVTSSRPLYLKDYSGTFTTKNYPGNYWNHQTCQWTIEAQVLGGTVSLKFNRFYTDLNNDFVYIYDGASTQTPLLARLSGPRDTPSLPITYNSSGMYITVVFTSDTVLTRYGFTADYTTVPPVNKV